MHRLGDPQPNTNRQPHNHRPNRDLSPELRARLQAPHRVPALRPPLLSQLRLLKRLLARPYRALLVCARGLLLREREPAGAAKGLGLGQAGLEIGFVGAEVGFGVCFCGLLGEGGGGVVVVEGGEGGGVAGARWGEGED